MKSTTSATRTRAATQAATPSKAAVKTRAKAAPKRATTAKAPTETADSPALPKLLGGLGLRELLEKAKLPGLNGVIEARQRDIEALLAANEQTYRGLETFNRRQAEILAETLKRVNAGAQEVLAEPGAAQKAGKAADLAKHVFSQALTHVTEIALATAKSHESVLQVLNKRHQERLDAMQTEWRQKTTMGRTEPS